MWHFWLHQFPISVFKFVYFFLILHLFLSRSQNREQSHFRVMISPCAYCELNGVALSKSNKSEKTSIFIYGPRQGRPSSKKHTGAVLMLRGCVEQVFLPGSSFFFFCWQGRCKAWKSVRKVPKAHRVRERTWSHISALVHTAPPLCVCVHAYVPVSLLLSVHVCVWLKRETESGAVIYLHLHSTFFSRSCVSGSGVFKFLAGYQRGIFLNNPVKIFFIFFF